MRKALSIILILALVLGVVGCGTTAPAPTTAQPTEPEPTEAEPAYTAGTYVETVMAMRGDLTVEVIVDDNAITSVKVLEHVDTPVIADAAIDTIPKAIVDGQTLAVDVVTGATLTSYAIIGGATQALRKAGADIDALRKASEKVPVVSGPDEEYDVVIVGAGGSGLSAAIELRRDTDLKVLVLEKLAYTGGSTRVAGGAIWMANTARNEAAEINFTPEELIEFMEWRSETTLNRPYLTRVGEITGRVATYLTEQGAPFREDRHSLGHPESKLFTLSPINEGTGYGGGILIDFLTDLSNDLGAEIRLNSKVTSLLTEGNAVVGVSVEGKGKTYNVMAKKVILATGGFTRNEEMIGELAPEYTNNIPFTGAGSTGDGITMTKDMNVDIVGTDMMSLKGLNHNFGYYGSIGGLVNVPGIILNKEGVRFASERLFYSEIGIHINRQTDKTVYGIVDSQSTRIEDLDKAVEMGLVYKADTLEALADAAGADKEAFLKTLSDYEAVRASGQDDPDFGVTNDRMVDISVAPFYAVPIKPLFIGSIPGLLVNAKSEVMTKSGDTIENLYACGELVFGNVFSKYYPASGTGVGFAVYTGAIAAESAKEAIQSTY
ncbi:MAG: FAD-dependent oxidoreductase [Eubacteriales bacterium]|nr:FAD-dependent oxidoreductase [Eubacteriales bacterium]